MAGPCARRAAHAALGRAAVGPQAGAPAGRASRTCMTIAELARDYRARRRTPIEVIEHALASLERWRTTWLISLDEPSVRRAASESAARFAAGSPRSLLEGVPVTVKDQFDVAGAATTVGTCFLREPKDRDADVVARLRR